MFCPHCGTKCPDDARFCESCGKPLAIIPPALRQLSSSADRESDALSATVSEIAANVQRAQVVPATVSVSTPTPPPAPVQKKSHTGLILTLVLVPLLLLLAAGGAGFYFLQVRAANEADLEANLMDYMWTYCESEILDYYDDALAAPYSERGYKVEKKNSAFSLRSTGDKNVFSVSGWVNIIDRNADNASYRVDINGTVKTDFMRTKYTWDMECDFEDPPAPVPEDEPNVPADDPVQSGGDSPAPDTPGTGTALPAPGSTDAAPQGYYLWPTDSQYITDADLNNFTRKEIMLMRNELYARYGCTFQDEEIRTYFMSQSWYEPVPDMAAVNFSVEQFNDYERANLDTILGYERAMGWRK